MRVHNPPRESEAAVAAAVKKEQSRLRKAFGLKPFPGVVARRKKKAKKTRKGGGSKMATKRKSVKRSRAAKKAARTRKANKLARSRAAKKAAKSAKRSFKKWSGRKSRKSRPKSRPKSRKSRGVRRTRRSRPTIFRRGRTRPTRRRHRPSLRYTKKGWRAPRRSKLFKKGRTSILRMNPPLIPSVSSVMGIVKDGLYLTTGWVGVNGARWAVRKYLIGSWQDQQSQTVQKLVDFGIRVLSIPLVAYVGGFVFKDAGARRLIVLGGAANAVFHGVKDVVEVAGLGNETTNALLLGDAGDYVSMNDYQTAGGQASSGSPFALSTGNDVFA